MIDAAEIAAALGGRRTGNGWICKCVCHDDRNPSLSIGQGVDGTVLLRCHAGCSSVDIIAELDRRGLWPERERRSVAGANIKPQRRQNQHDPADRIAFVRRLWREAKDPRATLVAGYLDHRGLPPLSDDQAGPVFRFHPNCPFGDAHLPCLIARFAPIVHDDGGEPTAIARIRLDRFEGDNRRLSLGPAAGQAVKLSADADVTLGIGIAEGIEKGLALLASGWRPVWTTIGTSTMRTFPVLGGVESLTVFCDRDDPGRDAALCCARRWRDAGAEARILQPPAPFKDWDAWWKAGAP